MFVLFSENVRHASSGAAGGGGGGLGKLAFATVGTTAIAVGGTVGYAAFDPGRTICALSVKYCQKCNCESFGATTLKEGLAKF